MIVIFLLIPLSIMTAAIFLAGFIWAVRSGQYEDTCTPSLRLLAEDSNATKTRDADVSETTKEQTKCTAIEK